MSSFPLFTAQYQKKEVRGNNGISEKKKLLLETPFDLPIALLFAVDVEPVIEDSFTAKTTIPFILLLGSTTEIF